MSEDAARTFTHVLVVCGVNGTLTREKHAPDRDGTDGDRAGCLLPPGHDDTSATHTPHTTEVSNDAYPTPRPALMPRAPKKCAAPGCEQRVTARTHCPKHAMNWQGNPRTNTPEYRTWRAAVLKRDNHQCQLQYPGCTGHANEADHKLAWAFGGTNTLENGRAACNNCHKLKTSRESKQARQAGASTPSPGTGFSAHGFVS